MFSALCCKIICKLTNNLIASTWIILYNRNMEKNLHKIYSQIVEILRRDYAGKDLCGERFDPRYYTQSIGQAAKEKRLDDLLFLRYVSQMLACIGDRHLRLELLSGEDYEPHQPGFRCRRFEDSLIVTEVMEDKRLKPGDVITAINGGSPSHHRALIQKNFFFSDDPEREDWSGLLKMAQTITLASGETLELIQYPKKAEARQPSLRIEDGIAIMDPGLFDGSGACASLLQEKEEALHACRRIVWDLRRGGGSVEEDILPLLAWLTPSDSDTAALLGPTDIYINYTPLNCALRAAALEGLPGAETYIAELHEKAGKGLLRETDEGEAIPVAGKAPAEVIVLTDTWCRDAGETFVLAAQRAGARLIGRPTLGTLDYCGDHALQLNDRFIFHYPSAVSAEALEGRGMQDTGILPDEYIPFTPEECQTDILLDIALG